MEDSILTSIKKVLGIDASYTQFDEDIIMHINSVFSTLYQIADLGAPNGFQIESSTETWDQFLGSDKAYLNMVKSYTYNAVRLLFDPPTNSFLLESRERQITEIGWRLQTYSPPATFSEEVPV